MRFLNISHKLSRALNPGLCLTCGIAVDTDHHICTHCLQGLRHVDNACTLCGLSNNHLQPVCAACLHKPPCWQHMIAPLVYSGTCRRLIQDFKFNEKIFTANALIIHLYPLYQAENVEVMLPVPLHRGRLLERGFNQSQEIAWRLSIHNKIPVDSHSLKRIRATESQSGLSLDKRRRNLVKGFQFDCNKRYRSAAVVDDVITSGSTMSEITKLLHRAGIESVQVWALARALKQG